jgi:branched-chain amino acid transport system substrate-binding protein
MHPSRTPATRRRVIGGLATAVAAPWIVPARAQANKPLRIALSVAQSGLAGVADHADYLNGAKLAVTEINKAGGVRGRPFKLEVFDIDLLTPEGTQATFRKIADAKPHAIGTAFCVIPRPSFEALGSYKAPYLHGSTQQNCIDLVKENPEKYSHIFQVDPPETYYGLMFPRFLEQLAAGGVWKPINNKVHIVREQSAYNQTIARAAQEAMKQSRFELARITDVQSPVQDWGPVQEELKGTGAGVIMIDHWVGAEEAAFCQQFVADPIKGALVYLQYGPSQPEFLNLAGPAAEGFVWSTVLGVYDDKQGAEFRRKYQAAHPGIMGLCYTGSAYDTMYMLRNAWAAVEPEDFKAVADYLRTHTYRGVDGAVDMNNPYQAALHYPLQTTDLNKGMAQLFFQVQNGQHRIIQPDVLAEKKFRPAPWMS